MELYNWATQLYLKELRIGDEMVHLLIKGARYGVRCTCTIIISCVNYRRVFFHIYSFVSDPQGGAGTRRLPELCLSCVYRRDQRARRHAEAAGDVSSNRSGDARSRLRHDATQSRP